MLIPSIAVSVDKLYNATSNFLTEMKTELPDFFNKGLEKIKNANLEEITNAAKPAFETLTSYSPHVATSLAGMFFAKGIEGLTNPDAKKYPLINFALSALAGGFVYSQNIENLSPLSHIFLVSAFATNVYLSKHSTVKSTHTVTPIDADPFIGAKKDDTPLMEEETTSSTITINDVTRPMTIEEKKDFDETMNKAFGPNSVFKKNMNETFGPNSVFKKNMNEAFGRNSYFSRDFRLVL